MKTLPKSSRASLVAVSLLLSSFSLASAQNNTGVTVGVYDENTFETNTVDTNATMLTAVTFTGNVATAFANNRGGVINFDNIGVNGGTGALTATFGAAQSKTLTLGYSDTNLSQYNIQNASTNVAPLSGNAGNPVGNYFIPLFPGTNDTPNSFTFTFGTLTGEAVTQTGFTLLGRNSNPAGTGTVTATFSNSTTASASRAFTTSGRGTEDTFFGFTAPTGLSIQSVTVSFTTGAGRAIDDFGFITTATVPEPSTYLQVMAIAGIAMLAGLRQLRCRRLG